jgi:putative membrane protein
MYYASYWGMNFIWWIIWAIMLFWIFFLPYDIPGQRNKKNTALEILQQRFAAGQLTVEEYKEKKKILENDIVKKP